jgi:hypothetical protein
MGSAMRVLVDTNRKPLRDFELALQVAAGQAAGVDWIITRNEADFQKSPIPALSPEQALSSIF